MSPPAEPAADSPDNVEKLKCKLRELFQLDRGDLDFGLYRVMAYNRDAVGDFLDNHLLPEVTKALSEIANHDTATLTVELENAITEARKHMPDPEQSLDVIDLRENIKATKAAEQIEADVYNHLLKFFTRYYDEGDFMSLRRYTSAGKDAYSIPYNGEEVKLHWANADQYYIKTTENYSSYVFRVGDQDAKVRFEIAAADNEKDNIQESRSQKRFFMPAEDFIAEEENQLIIRFDHRPLTAPEKIKYPKNGTKKQDTINADTEQKTLKKINNNWTTVLAVPSPTEKNESRTVLGKHLAAYTAKNSFDYFIHKNLGGFLYRELDNYLKSTVISIDNLKIIDNPLVFKNNLAQIKAIKQVGEKIIDFLAQLENFQKQLWEKKKFVLETQYCITLEKVPESLYAEIIQNDAQIDEWVKLCAIDQLNGDAVTTAYSRPLKQAFLEENPFLVLDTRYFDVAFTEKLLAALSESGPIDEQMNGLLVHGENFQGLNLLQEKYRSQVKCVYIDPPYNTDASAILYKNGYKDSSWLSLMDDRLRLSKLLLLNVGALCCAIDEEEAWRLRAVLQDLFVMELGVAPVRTTPAGRKTGERFSPTHEYAFFFGMENAVPGTLQKTEKEKARYPFVDDVGQFAWNNLIRHGSGDKREDVPTMYYPIYIGKNDALRVPKMEWDESAREYKILEKPKPDEKSLWPIRDGVEKRWHRGWERIQSGQDEYRVRDNGEGLSIDFKIRMDEQSMPKTWWDSNEYSSANHGSRIMKALFFENPFDYPKSVRLVEDCVVAAGGGDQDALILDFFAGSGTTGHAVINLNREDSGKRKYILMEMGHHFNDVIIPRMKKVIYSEDWENGKPEDREGISQFFKYIRLESYEDALDSLQVTHRDDLVSAMESKAMTEDYKLRYALGVETADNVSLMGNDFSDPFNHTLSVVREGVRSDVKVDIAETFNFLLGLRETARRKIENILIITGTAPDGANCLILWRNTAEINAEQLDKWFDKHHEVIGDDFNLIYVNGDHTLNARAEVKWKAHTTEPVFKKLMFGGV